VPLTQPPARKFHVSRRIVVLPEHAKIIPAATNYFLSKAFYGREKAKRRFRQGRALMKSDPRENAYRRGVRLVTEAESRIARQRQIIAELKRQGHPTETAESLLISYERSLPQLRNHVALMLDLLKPGGERSF
jgi:hypothetical protein